MISLYVHQKTKRFLDQLGWANVGIEFEGLDNPHKSNELVSNSLTFSYPIPRRAVDLSRENLILLDKFMMKLYRRTIIIIVLFLHGLAVC